MKVAFPTSGHGLDDPLDPRFGRAARFLVYELERESFEMIDNAQNLNAPQGAGVQSAGVVARSGAQVLVTGHCGPKAFQVLAAAGVTVLTTDAPTVREALARYQAGRLTPAEAPNVEGHWE